MVKNRSEMISKFDEVLIKNFERFKDEKKNETNQLKSYIIENHVAHNSTPSHDSVAAFLQEIFKNQRKISIKLKETEDEQLFVIDSNVGEMYLDISQKRFWVLHASVKAKHSDLVHKIILKDRKIDNIWLPIPFLKGLKRFGDIYGMGISFTEYLKKDEMDDFLFPNQNTLNLDIRRLYVNQMLTLLETSDLKEVIGINKVTLLDSTIESQDFIVDDITYFGKITGRGTSFSKHHSIIQNILMNYSSKIINLEEKFSYSFDPNTHSLKGQPIEIHINRTNINLKKLVDTIFSGKKPYYLWGVPDWRDETYCRVNSVDLHSGNFGNSLEFEIMPNLIRVLLPKDSCGNTISRLLTNIHQSIDATSYFKEGAGEHEFFSII
ncbi:hypothetical protein [Cytobacillus praedii]|uniref:hypothetical protein n=1 Tax=Cytobacillus praedii TaxID=1742358 RepID=UPI00071061DB|nr:hypothetical protein [Cytobacillus praedii]